MMTNEDLDRDQPDETASVSLTIDGPVVLLVAEILRIQRAAPCRDLDLALGAILSAVKNLQEDVSHG